MTQARGPQTAGERVLRVTVDGRTSSAELMATVRRPAAADLYVIVMTKYRVSPAWR